MNYSYEWTLASAFKIEFGGEEINFFLEKFKKNYSPKSNKIRAFP